MGIEKPQHLAESLPRSWHYNPNEDFLHAEESTAIQRLASVEVFAGVCSGEERMESCCMKQWIGNGLHDSFREWVTDFIHDHPDRDILTYEDMLPKLREWKEKFGTPTVH